MMKITSARSAALLGAGAIFVSGSAFGAPVVDELMQELTFEFELSPGATTLAFDQFDDQGGTRNLLKIVLMVDAQISAAATAENDSPLPAPDFALNLTGFLTTQVADLTTLNTFSETFLTDGMVGPTDGMPGEGDDFWDFGVVTVFDSDMAMATTGLGDFVGTGTIDANVAGSAGFAISGATDSTLSITDFLASGTVKLIYQYEQVPAPGALALLGLAGLVVRRRRR